MIICFPINVMKKNLKKIFKKKIIFFDIGYNLGFETNKLKKIL